MSELPILTEITSGSNEHDPEPLILNLADEAADELVRAVHSSTARQLLQQLRESPAHPSELANHLDTSIQNVHYHLGKLEEAGAVTSVDTVYSEKGREMTVYAPTADPLVLVSGGADERQDVVEALSRLLGAVGILALGSVAVQEFVEAVFYAGGPTWLAREGGAYGSVPMTNVAPPVGLVVFLAGLLALAGWARWR